MSRAKAAEAIGTTHLTKLSPHQVLWHPKGVAEVTSAWCHVQSSIRQHGLIKSSLLLTLALNGVVSGVTFLLDKGADINMKSEYYKRTPLTLASEKAHYKVVKALLDRGADIHIKDQYSIVRLFKRVADGTLDGVDARFVGC